MRYLRTFGNHNNYEDFTETEAFVKPNVSYCITEDEVHYNPIPHDYSKDYLTFDILEGGVITWKASSEKTTGTTISYSINNGQWTDITSSIDGETFNVSARDKVRFKGSNSTYGIKEAWDVYCTTFSSSTASFNIEGNIMSLLYGDDFIDKITFLDDYIFPSLFKETNVVNTHNLILPAMTLPYGSYSEMFRGCTSLITAPELPATTLPEYQNSSDDGCYNFMFYGCTSLTTAPSILPATKLKKCCYNYMFYGCTSLTTAPVLPATILVDNCYSGMFYGCTNLNYIKAMFTTTPSGTYTDNWVKNVASNGTFVKNSAATWNVTGNHGIPTGWIVETASE